jgi:hypothetical protein
MRQDWFARDELERMIADGSLTCGNTLAAYSLFRIVSDAERPGVALT